MRRIRMQILGIHFETGSTHDNTNHTQRPLHVFNRIDNNERFTHGIGPSHVRGSRHVKKVVQWIWMKRIENGRLICKTRRLQINLCLWINTWSPAHNHEHDWLRDWFLVRESNVGGLTKRQSHIDGPLVVLDKVLDRTAIELYVRMGARLVPRITVIASAPRTELLFRGSQCDVMDILLLGIGIHNVIILQKFRQLFCHHGMSMVGQVVKVGTEPVLVKGHLRRFLWHW
mmetsp:Transcript_26951/g.44888  ORF Transcript_26951/g.44888 Transcript_26951/m.44888 type:complete len:229 (+) Transcript_26951:577-1263(+)